MRTSGGGDSDLRMLAVPLAILLAYAFSIGGGIENTLRTMEHTLWMVVDWAGKLTS